MNSTLSENHVNRLESLFENTFTRLCCLATDDKFEWDIEPNEQEEKRENLESRERNESKDEPEENKAGILEVLKNFNFYFALIAYGFWALRLQSMVAWLSGGWPEWVVGGLV